jgi:hypothetical protein
MGFKLKFCLRTSMRLMTVAAVSAESTSVNTADTETVVNPIAIAENDSESESDEEQDNVISNTGTIIEIDVMKVEEYHHILIIGNHKDVQCKNNVPGTL